MQASREEATKNPARLRNASISAQQAGLTSEASAFLLVDQENARLNLSCQRDGLGLALVKNIPQRGGDLPVPDGPAQKPTISESVLDRGLGLRVRHALQFCSNGFRDQDLAELGPQKVEASCD